MKANPLAWALAACLALPLTAPAKEAKTTLVEVRSDLTRTAGDLAAASREEREAYQARVAGELSRLKYGLSTQRIKLRSMAKAARKQAREKIETMKSQERGLRRQLKELKLAGMDKWGDLRQAFDKSLGDLKNAYKDFADSMKPKGGNQ